MRSISVFEECEVGLQIEAATALAVSVLTARRCRPAHSAPAASSRGRIVSAASSSAERMMALPTGADPSSPGHRPAVVTYAAATTKLRLAESRLAGDDGQLADRNPVRPQPEDRLGHDLGGASNDELGCGGDAFCGRPAASKSLAGSSYAASTALAIAAVAASVSICATAAMAASLSPTSIFTASPSSTFR